MSTSARGLWDCGLITDLADTIKHLPWRLDQSRTSWTMCVEQTAGVITHTHTDREREKCGGAGCDKKERERVMDEERMSTDESGRKDTMRKMKWWGNRRVGRHWKQVINDRERERENKGEDWQIKLNSVPFESATGKVMTSKLKIWTHEMQYV